MEQTIVCGSLLTGGTINPTDYPIRSTDIRAIKPRFSGGHVQMDQRDLEPFGNVSCFYTAAFKIVADAYPLDTQEMRDRAVKAWKAGWAAIVKDVKVTPGFGGRLSDGIDYARRAWNAEFPDKKVITYVGEMPRFDKGNADRQLHFYRAIFNGWAIMFGGHLSESLANDILLDGVLNSDEKPVDKSWGHARTMYGYEPKGDKGGVVKVSDNYPKLKGFPNIHLMDDLEEKVSTGQVFGSYFVAFPA